MKLCVPLIVALWCLLVLPGCMCAGWHWEPPSPLMAAIENNDVGAVQRIVERHGEDLDAVRLHKHAMYGDLDFVSDTPLSLAVGSPDLLRILVRGGAAVNGRERENCTALGYAIEYEMPDSVATLLDLGADPMLPMRSTSTFTIYSEAMQSYDPRVREVMRGWAERRAGSGDRKMQPAGESAAADFSAAVAPWAAEIVGRMAKTPAVEEVVTVAPGAEGRRVGVSDTVVARVTVLSRDATTVYFVQAPAGRGSGVFTTGKTGPVGIFKSLEGLGVGGRRVVSLTGAHAFPRQEWAPAVPAGADVIVVSEVLDIGP